MKALFYLNKYFLKYKWRLLLGVIFVSISSAFGVLMPREIGHAIDFIGHEITKLSGSDAKDASSTIIQFALGAAAIYMGLAIAKGIFLFFTRQTIIIMSRYIEYDLKNEVYAHYQKLDTAFYKRNNTGDLMNRISEDISRVRMYLGPAIMYTINLFVLFILVVTAMVNINAELTLYVLIPLPIMSVTIYYVSNIINRRSEAVQRQQSNLSTYVQEAFSGIRVLKAYNKEASSQADFAGESENYKKRSLHLVMVNALFFPAILLLIGLSTILAIYIGGVKAINGEGISMGDIAQFVIYVNMLTWPFASVGWVTSLVQRAAASQERINEFLQQEPEIENPNTPEQEIEGKIEFKNVSFVYPDSGIKALNDLSFTLEQGKTLAVIGHTGSGKSTIAGLICRQYDASSGSILIDDQAITTINLNSLRSNVGYVPQEVFLFSDTIANNIAFGLKTEEIKQGSIENAAKDAAIFDNIMAFNDQFETVLGERGITLSGGQKQRVSIARALIKSPHILIFDDCLSAVDTETEETILNNLKRIMDNRTSIIISHRVSSVKHADHIIVLEEGKISEEGNHSDLIDKKGIYFDLYEKQLLEDEKIIT
jgi:ATP-binding cassette subfamily B multidrug efflux pump